MIFTVFHRPVNLSYDFDNFGHMLLLHCEIYHWCTENLTEGKIKEVEKVIYFILYTHGTIGNLKKKDKLMQQCITVEIFWSKGQYTCIDQHCCRYAGRLRLLLSRFLLLPLMQCKWTQLRRHLYGMAVTKTEMMCSMLSTLLITNGKCS
jgi:hypothetical protein